MDIGKMSPEELAAELRKLKEELCDIEDMHSFTFQKTSVHMGAEKADSMQVEFDEECREIKAKIERIEKALAAKGAL
ncbi:MAG: hypothetical protein M0018_00515 [Nitrospiraceae bacterium]|nr:hypothetical protein [Nitrospiraceae bacterium]